MNLHCLLKLGNNTGTSSVLSVSIEAGYPYKFILQKSSYDERINKLPTNTFLHVFCVEAFNVLLINYPNYISPYIFACLILVKNFTILK